MSINSRHVEAKLPYVFRMELPGFQLYYNVAMEKYMIEKKVDFKLIPSYVNGQTLADIGKPRAKLDHELCHLVDKHLSEPVFFCLCCRRKETKIILAFQRLHCHVGIHRWHQALEICYRRSMLIGNAIDAYITGDYAPGEMAGERFAGVLRATGVYALVLIALFIGHRFQYLLMQKTGQEIIYGIRQDLFQHVESLTMRFFDITPVGKIVTRLTNDVESINDVFANILVRLFQNSIKIIGLAVIMLFLNPRMALLSFILVPLVAFLTWLSRTLSRKAYQVTRTRLTALNTYLSEHLSGMRIIQLF